MTSLQQPLSDLLEFARQFDIQVSPLSGQLACVFVGEWNAGKSSLINSLIGAELLPVEVKETTKTIVRLSKSQEAEPSAKVEIGQGQVQHLTGAAAVEAVQQSREDIPGIEFSSPSLDMPLRTTFIDTPGLNSQNHWLSSKAETVSADIVVFVMQGVGASLNETQVKFIQDIILTKAEMKDLYFIATWSDVLDSEQQRTVEEKFVETGVPLDQLFFVSNKTQAGIAHFKKAFYAYLEKRQGDLLDDRRHKYQKQVAEALHERVMTERALIADQKDRSAEQRQALLVQIQEAKTKERRKKEELRGRSDKRLRDAQKKIDDTISEIIGKLQNMVDHATVDDLQRKGYLQGKLETAIEEQFNPVAQSTLDQLLREIQGDVDEAGQFSQSLVADLEISLPEYHSPLARVTAEHILPLATLGSIMLMGWVSIPTLVLGYMTLKARELGLTRSFDQIGLLDIVINKGKELAASGFKEVLKLSIDNTLTGLRDRTGDYYHEVVEKATDKALANIRYAEDLEKSLQQMRDESAVIRKEILLDKAEQLLKAYYP